MTDYGPLPPLEKIAVPLVSDIADGPPDIIPGLLPRQGELLVAGETNIGKSLLALEICSTLSTGVPLWGSDSLKPNLQARKILYILGEHYVEVLQRLWQKTGLPMTDKVLVLGPEHLGADKWLVAKGQQSVIAKEKFQRWADGCDLVVFDPLAAFVGGQDAENDNVQMRMVIDTMTGICHENGASCLVLAHQGKPFVDKNGEEHARTRYAIRGASAIEDAATNIFYMGLADPKSFDAKNLPPGHKVFDVVCRKYKGQSPERYRISRDPKTLTHTLLGARPFNEVHQLDTVMAFDRIMKLDGLDLKKSDTIRILAAVKNCDPRTVRNHLNGHGELHEKIQERAIEESV